MPSIVELLKSKGVEISDELAKEIPSLVEHSDEVVALRETKNDLLKFKQDTLTREEQQRKEREEKEAKDLLDRENLAKEKNDLAALVRINEERAQKEAERANTLRESLKSSAHESEVNAISSWFTSDVYGKDVASTKVKTELDETGKAIHVYSLGGVNYGSREEFKAALTQISDYASVMKGVDSRGAPANGGGGKPATKKPEEYTESERVTLFRTDPAKFSELFPTKG